MNEKKLQRVITLKDLWYLFLRRSLVIILAAMVAGGFVYIRQKTSYVPLYSSTATLYITRDGEYPSTNSTEAYNYFTLALKVVNDCSYFLESRSVVDQVIKDLNLPMSYERLSDRITTENPVNTRILEVTVKAESPELAQQIVNRVCELGRDKIDEAMGAKYVVLYEYGTLSNTPANSVSATTALLVAAGVMVGVYAFFLLLFLLDDRIRTDEDMEQLLGLSVLGDIPDLQHSHRGYYGYYRRYNYGAYTNRKTKKK